MEILFKYLSRSDLIREMGDIQATLLTKKFFLYKGEVTKNSNVKTKS